MGTTNLVQYILSWWILRNIEQLALFDVVLFERLPEFENDEDMAHGVHIQQLEEVWFWIAWELLAYHHEYDRVLVILDTTPSFYLTSILPKLNTWKTFHILNTHAWVWSMLYKGIDDIFDMQLFSNYNITASEPYDVRHFFDLLQQDWVNYTRVPDGDYVSNLFGVTTDTPLLAPILDMTSHGFSWNATTVVCTWSTLLDTLKEYESIEDDNEKFDIFCVTTFPIQPLDSFIASCASSWHIILDSANDWMVQYIKAIIYDKQPDSMTFELSS